MRDTTLEEVYRAQEMFCTGTMGEIAPVIEVDGRTIGNGEMGVLTSRIGALFAAEVPREGVSVV